MKKKISILLALVVAFSIFIVACGKDEAAITTEEPAAEEPAAEEPAAEEPTAEEPAAEEPAIEDEEEPEEIKPEVELVIDDYEPSKDSYYFSYTYKLIHPWYDPIKLGIEDAIAQYSDKYGVDIEFDYTAPVTADALEQINMIESAAAKNPDVVGIDVNQIDLTTPLISELTASGVKVITFSGGDAPDSERICFIGNTSNDEDGAKLAEALAEAIDYEGEVACLDGSIGASSHEERIVGFDEVMAKYPDIEVVDRQRDDDDLEKAIQQTEAFIQKHPDLKGIWCNNMTNPIGAAQAVKDAGKSGEIIIVGMDHDLRTLEYLESGVIHAAQIQNCYEMGFYLVETSIKAADGMTVGNGIEEERFNVGSTTIFQDRAAEFIEKLYGN